MDKKPNYKKIIESRLAEGFYYEVVYHRKPDSVSRARWFRNIDEAEAFYDRRAKFHSLRLWKHRGGKRVIVRHQNLKKQHQYLNPRYDISKVIFNSIPNYSIDEPA